MSEKHLKFWDTEAHLVHVNKVPSKFNNPVMAFHVSTQYCLNMIASASARSGSKFCTWSFKSAQIIYSNPINTPVFFKPFSFLLIMRIIICISLYNYIYVSSQSSPLLENNPNLSSLSSKLVFQTRPSVGH